MLKVICVGMMDRSTGRRSQPRYQPERGNGRAMDAPMTKMTNLLVGNAQDAAVLEITLDQFCATITRPG
ncbi:MAG: hypothetical protein GPOALKHO_000881 [Sodalis sp.]|uniref:hypothetical protein n=1 Tax=Sodalis sp. (in: enterobacteria) TaxID=1898979 RepID=UPI0038730498|nr:MAG: hypothetical protein GPOALKHO_000881 [Sodalis sp.]